jgi:predicted transglutaminase-like cysteine proteinase
MLTKNPLGLLLALGIALPAAAQTTAATAATPRATKAPAPTPTSAAARAEALTANMTQALGLTPAQQEKVRVINANSVRNVETARQRYGQEPAKLRGYIDDVSLARLDQLKDVLTPAQFARYQQKREEKMGIPTIRGNQGTPPPGLPGNRGDD